METNKNGLNIYFVRCSKTENGTRLKHAIYGVSIYFDNERLITIKEDSLHTLGMLLEDHRERKESFDEIELFEFDY